MMKQKPIVYSIAEVAQLLDISRSYAYKLVQQGELPVLDIGTRRVIPKAYLDEWIREKVKKISVRTIEVKNFDFMEVLQWIRY